jgi:Toastrack DUF4097
MSQTSSIALIAPILFASVAATSAQPRMYVERPEPRVRTEWHERYQESRRGPEQTERFSKVIRSGRNATLYLESLSGTVSVTGADGDEIQIDALKRVRSRDENRARAFLANLEVRVVERVGRVEVRTVFPRPSGSLSAAVDFTIRVPTESAVELKSVSGDLRVTNVRGQLRLESMSGDVRVGQAPRLALAKTMSGDVEVISAAMDGELNASSMSGSVTVKDVKARVIDLNTVSGNLIVVDVDSDRARLKSITGDLQFAGTIHKTGRYDLNTHSGRILFAVPASVGFEVDASTFMGNLRSDLPLTITSGGSSDVVPTPPTPSTTTTSSGSRQSPRVRIPRGRMPRSQTIRGSIGDASAFVIIRTFSGDIVIEKR